MDVIRKGRTVNMPGALKVLLTMAAPPRNTVLIPAGLEVDGPSGVRGGKPVHDAGERVIPIDPCSRRKSRIKQG